MNEYSSISPLYGGSLPLNLKQVLHHASMYVRYDSPYKRDSSIGYLTLEEFLIKSNYPKEVIRDIDIAIEDRPLQSVSVLNLFADSEHLYFNLRESNMDCTKIYLDFDLNKVPIKYLSYIKLGEYEWGSYLNQ